MGGVDVKEILWFIAIIAGSMIGSAIERTVWNLTNGGDTMEWVNFKVKEGEREKLKNDAHAHRMNISEYLRWLIDKQRKEDENAERDN